MFNLKCKSGKKTKAARRAAAMLMTGALGASLAVTGINPGIVNVSAASWQENAEYIFEYLTQRLNYSEAAACGIMANIRCESTFNPHAWNAGGGSYGLCQWTGGRYSRLRNWCSSNGYDYTTIDGQLAYLQFELLNHYTGVENYIRSVENTSEGAYLAGQYYCYHFEAPASRGSVSVYRGNLASGVFWDSYRPAEWYQTDGVWHYILRDGSYKTGWLEIEGDTFYLDEDGNRISGWKNIKGNRYFFDDDGLMVSGWKKIDGRSYYFNEDGELITGLIQGNDDLYLVNKNGDLKYSAAVEDHAVAWAEEAARRQTELAAAGTTQFNQSSPAGSGSKAVSGLNKEAAVDDGTEPSDNSENTFEIATALADARTEAVTGTGSTQETETVTALVDARTEAGTGAGSTQETETVTALADAGFDSADQTQNITSSVDLLKKKEDTGDLPKIKEDTGNIEMQDAEAEPEASSPGEVIREDKAVSDSTKPEETEGLADLLPAELLRQAAEYIQKASNTQQGKDADYAQQSEDPDTFPDQYAAAAQASLSAAVALNLVQEEEERLPDPSIGLAYAFYHDQPEVSDRILNQFKSEESSTESQKTGNEDQPVQDSASKSTEAQLTDHDQAGEETGNGIDLPIPALALADKHQDQQEESPVEEKESASDTDQEISDESDDRESSDTSGTAEKAAASEEAEMDKDTGSATEETEEDKGTGAATGTKAEESEEDKETGSTEEESEEDKGTGAATGTTAEESEEDKDTEAIAEESEEAKDTGSTEEESEEDKDAESTEEESEEDKNAGSAEEESEKDKETGSTAEESEEDKESGSDTEESEEGKTDEQREQDEDDTSSGHSDKDSSDKDASEEADDASSGHSSENVSDKNADDDSADSAGTRDEEREKNSRKDSERGEDKEDGSVKKSELEDNAKEDSKIHIRLTEKKFYDISEEELEDLADILRERKVLHVVDEEDKDITSKTYMDVEKINKRDYGFSVIIRAEYGDSSDEEKVRIYLTR